MGILCHWGVCRELLNDQSFFDEAKGRREYICNDVILVSFVLDFEGIFGEAKDPAFDPGGRGKIASEKISESGMIRLN